MNLKNPDLDLNWSIHSKCRLFGFMIRFWILVKKKGKKTQNLRLDSRIRIWILPKKRTLI